MAFAAMVCDEDTLPVAEAIESRGVGIAESWSGDRQRAESKFLGDFFGFRHMAPQIYSGRELLNKLICQSPFVLCTDKHAF
jgi:hypothetical protein